MLGVGVMMIACLLGWMRMDGWMEREVEITAALGERSIKPTNRSLQAGADD
jgi:hypothetical protein